MTRSRMALAAVGVTGALAGLGASTAIAAAPDVTGATGAASASPSAAARPAPRDARRLSRTIRKVMGQASIPGAIVGIWRPHQAAYVRAFGVRNRRTRRPMTTNLYMRIGSETKTFTVTAVLQLVDKHELRLDDPIGRFIHGVPDGNQITIRELAGMRSGIRSYTANPVWVRKLQANPFRQWAPRQLLPYSFSEPLLFPPGTASNYSNTNTVLLGMVVQKLSGEKLPVYIERHILDPEHLDHTSFATTARFPSPHANGYTRQTASGRPADATNWNPSWGWAAGAMISNVTDLRAWAKDVATGTLLTRRTQAQRERFVTGPGSGGSGYGLGLFRAGGWVGHNGSLPGYQSVTVYLPSRRATLVILANSDIPYRGAALPTALAGAITRIISPRHVYTLPGA